MKGLLSEYTIPKRSRRDTPSLGGKADARNSHSSLLPRFNSANNMIYSYWELDNMFVTCVRNNSKDLSYDQKADLLRHIHYENAELQDLDVGKVYQVFGLVFRDNVPWYYMDAGELGYPSPYPFHYFKPMELAIPSTWRMVVRQLGGHCFETSILPDFWAKDLSIYERLLDKDPDATGKFRTLMDD